jgi:hypothetical protein
VIIRVDANLLEKQIECLDDYVSANENRESAELIDGAVNLLSEILYALQDNRDVEIIQSEWRKN